MKAHKTNIFKRILLYGVLLAGILFLTVSLCFPDYSLTTEDFGTPRVLNDWYAIIDKAPYGSVAVPNSLSPTKQMSLYTNLFTVESGEYISLQTANTRVKIFADKELIYEFGFEGAVVRPIPCIMFEHLVSLKPEYSGKLIEISLYPVHYPANRLTKPVLVGTPLQIQLYNISSMRISDNIGYVLGVIGLVFLLYALYEMLIKREKNISLFLLGTAYLLLGTKICMQVCLRTSLVTDPYSSFYLFWFSFIGVTMVLCELMTREGNELIRAVFSKISVFFRIFFIVSMLLTLLNIEFYSSLLMLYYFVNIIMLIYTVKTCLKAGLKKSAALLPITALLTMDTLNNYLQFIPIDYLAYNTIQLIYMVLYLTYMIFARKTREGYDKQYEHEAILMKNNALMQSMNEVEKYTTELEKLRHDMKKHMLLVDNLITGGEVAKASEYIREICGEVDAHTIQVSCPNHIVAAILRQKIQSSEQHNIDFTYEAMLPVEIGVNDMDVCSVFANCLDNALEACTYVDKGRYIRLTSYIKNEYLFLHVENSAPAVAPPKQRGRGLGLRIINDIVDKYNGMLNVEKKDGCFIIEMALKCTPT